METMEKDLEMDVAEDQISFDFLLNEETQTLEKAESFEWIKDETLVLLVRSQKNVSPDFDICGKKMIDWVKMATSICTQKVVEDAEDVLALAKEHAEGYNFVAVIYSDTPLLKNSTFCDIMNFFSRERMNVLQLQRGYVFRTGYLQNARMILSSNETKFGDEDFLVVDNAEKLSHAFDVLQGRILDYHKQNGVVLFGENTIFIDADVEIEDGCVIYPNNVIKGESYIGKNVILESGNYILDTIVCDEAFVCQSYLEKSKISNGKVVGPFDKIINQKF